MGTRLSTSSQESRDGHRGRLRGPGRDGGPPRSGRPELLAAAARAAATPLRRTGRADTALQLLGEAHDELGTAPRPSAADLDASGMVALTAAYTAAQARMPSVAEQFASLAEQTAARLLRDRGRVPAGAELSPAQVRGRLYRVGIHQKLGDVDRALAYAAGLEPAALTTPERRARAATDHARAPARVRAPTGPGHPPQ
ncbi:hypothetical protein ACN6AT_37945 (plasmid) [Streptomyces sp. JL4002]|uniref:hypothetical protein n=1 Tax=Streptomyces sp. JL4002 TaxID=3404781 RepID=UPI003B27F81E